MPAVEGRATIIAEKPVKQGHICYHCGTPCLTDKIHDDDKYFCCEGCRLVYEVINSNGLCDYYKIQSHPGLTQVKAIRNNKYAYLDNEEIARQLYKFTDGKHVIVTLYIPGVHCSSCMWLLEHLHKLNNGITESRLNFSVKEVTIHFLTSAISLRQVVELLATIGYEPYISLDDSGKKKAVSVNRARIYKLGVAGFCFGNIMMMSFPEYLSHDGGIENQYALLFRALNLVLSLPVFFYSASEFFATAWAGLKQKVLNIDAPIALAIFITFARSVYEIVSGTGAGYLDSMSGIVLFMLVGRIVQERTYKFLSFHRDYKAYFPIAVNVLTPGGNVPKKLQDLEKNDVVQLYNEDIIPADAIVLKGEAEIDYSFVTGESEPVKVPEGKLVYAGGRQVGGELVIQVIKPVAGSYLTSLWNHSAFLKNKTAVNTRDSAVNTLSRYFTLALFALAAITAAYWAVANPAKILPSVSAMLIVACPCALLLAVTYTNGNLLRILSNNGLYLRDASVIEQTGNIDHIVFDKTGTLTRGGGHFSEYGYNMSDTERDWVYSVAAGSKHPYSCALATYLGPRVKVLPEKWNEIPGKGIEAVVKGNKIRIGSPSFLGVQGEKNGATVYVAINDKIAALNIMNGFREHISEVISALAAKYPLSLLSGDNDRQLPQLKNLFGGGNELLFWQKPEDKLAYIENLQKLDKKVLMVGDGLNDAGALQQSNVGITMADDINSFTPSCDAILDAAQFGKLPQLLKLGKAARQIINISFTVSILYNIIGLSISALGQMNPMIAAILMPVSTLSIVLLTTGVSNIWARRLGLTVFQNKKTDDSQFYA